MKRKRYIFDEDRPKPPPSPSRRPRRWMFYVAAFLCASYALGQSSGGGFNIVDLIRLGGVSISVGNGASGTGVLRVTLANDSTGILASVTQNPDVRQATAANLNMQAVGSIAHGASDSGNPVKIGGVARSYGSAVTAESAGERVDFSADRQGVPFTLPFHPNATQVEYLWTTAQTNDALVSVSSGTRIVVTGYQIQISSDTTVKTTVRCGFGTSTLATAPTDGNTAAGTFASIDVVPGAGANAPYGFVAIGADDEDVRCTTAATTGGTGRMFVFYYTTAN